MTSRPNPLLVLTLTVLAALAVMAIVAFPVLWAQRLSAGNVALSDRLDAIKTGRTSGLAPSDLLSADNPLVGAASAGRAGALLQLRLDELAAIHGVSIRSAQIMPARREGDLTHIMVAVTMLATTQPLQQFMLALETSFPLLVIDDMSIRALGSIPSQPVSAGPPGSSDRAMPLEVTLVVRGLAAMKDAP